MKKGISPKLTKGLLFPGSFVLPFITARLLLVLAVQSPAVSTELYMLTLLQAPTRQDWDKNYQR